MEEINGCRFIKIGKKATPQSGVAVFCADSIDRGWRCRSSQNEETAPSGLKLRETDFYDPFAKWLKDDLDEVTEVAPLGAASMKTKGGTPDVIGVYQPLVGNLIKFPLELVSAETKIDPLAPVVAFGQAMAYRLFSAKTYVAMPTTLSEEDQSRLESLAMLFGIGLVLFDLDRANPNFSIRVRAQRFLADMFYVNEFADRLKLHDAEVFEKLQKDMSRRSDDCGPGRLILCPPIAFFE
jgi:hypothetical protein